MTEYLIWSNKHHGMWWGTDRRGYTHDLAQAGRYTRTEALLIVNRSNYMTEPGDDPNSVMVVAPPLDAPDRKPEEFGRKAVRNV